MFEFRLGAIDLWNEDLLDGLDRVGITDVTIDSEAASDAHQAVLDRTHGRWGSNPHLRLTGKTPRGLRGSVSVDLASGDVWGHRNGFKTSTELEVCDRTPEVVDRAIGLEFLTRGQQPNVARAIKHATTMPIALLDEKDVDLRSMVFRRYAESMRDAYGHGRLTETYALASAVGQFGSSKQDRTVRPAAVLWRVQLDRHEWKRYDEHRGQEAQTFQLRVLEQFVEVSSLTNVQRRRLELIHVELSQGYSIRLVTPEVTLDDLRKYPSMANLRPDLGEPLHRQDRSPPR